jgi:two-component system, OmpR family, sensor histidine kinase KdpD
MRVSGMQGTGSVPTCRWRPSAVVLRNRKKLMSTAKDTFPDPEKLEHWLRRGAHDLRGNVATIEFALQGLKRFSPEGGAIPQGEVLEILRRRTGVLKGDIDQLFLFLRLALLPAPEPKDAADTMAEKVLASVLQEIPVGQRSRLPSVAVCGSRALFPGFLSTAAVLPVIRNALQYGSGPIGMSCTEVGEAVVLDVSNRGPGIPPEEREAIFEPFVRGVHMKPQPGMGLGLAVARLASARIGGSVELISATPHDTRFRVQLPLTSSGH